MPRLSVKMRRACTHRLSATVAATADALLARLARAGGASFSPEHAHAAPAAPGAVAGKSVASPNQLCFFVPQPPGTAQVWLE